MQTDLTDLHIVSNAESLAYGGHIATVGDQETREWSALAADFAVGEDTVYADKIAEDEDGVL